jgi:hypothetical protein
VKGELGLIDAARSLQDEIMSPSLEPPGDGLLEAEHAATAGFKKVALAVLGTAMQTYGERVSDEQEVLTWTADILMDAFAAESVVLRALAADASRNSNTALHAAAAQVFVADAALRVEATGRQALAAMTDGDTLRVGLSALRRFTKLQPVNTVALRREIAARVQARTAYPFP